MAINQALIRPDAVGAFTETFRTVDAAMRDRQRLEMAERQMQERAIQQARENKANDFKMMMMALERGDKLQQNSISNDLQRQQLEISQYGSDTARFNANTSRYNAFNPRGPRGGSNGDPMGLRRGLGGGSTGATAPRIPQSLPGDPAAIQGDYGRNINSDVSTPGNQDVANLLGDLDMMGRGVTPPSYAPSQPQAPQPDLLAAPPPPDAVPLDTPLEPPVAPPVAPADNMPVPATPDLQPGDPFPPPAPGAPAGAPAPIPAIPETPVNPAAAIPAAPVDPVAGLLPPPVLPESFANTNLTKGNQDILFNLRRTENELKKEATLAASKAARFTAALPRVDPDDPELMQSYNDTIIESERKAVESAGAANEAAARAQVLEGQMEGVKKRQLALASIADLDNVLPATDRAQIARLAADPAGGGQADKLITDMAKYSEVRNAFGYDYPSKGLATAQRVARTGAQILSDAGRKDEMSWREQTNADRMLAELKATDTSAMTPDDKKDLEKQKDLWRKQSITNSVGAAAHLERVKQVKNAVDADRMSDPTPIYDGPLPPPGTPYQDPAAAPATAIPITPLGPPGLGLDAPPAESEMMRNARVQREGVQQQANQFWTQGKEQAFNMARLGDATDAELRSIVSGGGRTVPTSNAPEYAQETATRGVSVIPHDDFLASQIAGTFKMPAGADNPAITGRSVSLSPLGVKDFIRAAANDELRAREAKARGAQPTVAPVPAEKKDAINAGRAAAGLPPL